MKHPNIKKCTQSSIPKASGMDICPSIIPAISRCQNKGLTSEWLKGRLKSHIMAHFMEPACSQIS